jgi:hypothetical protein
MVRSVNLVSAHYLLDFHMDIARSAIMKLIGNAIFMATIGTKSTVKFEQQGRLAALFAFLFHLL